MKKLIKPITILSLGAGLFLFQFNSKPQPAAVAQERPAAVQPQPQPQPPQPQPQPAGPILKKLDEATAAVDAYQKATNEKLAKAEAEIAELKANVESLKGEVATLKSQPPVAPPVVLEQPLPTVQPYVVPTYNQVYYYPPCPQPTYQPVRRGLIFRR